MIGDDPVVNVVYIVAVFLPLNNKKKILYSEVTASSVGKPSTIMIKNDDVMVRLPGSSLRCCPQADSHGLKHTLEGSKGSWLRLQ